jgi:hypothetical protein
MSKRNWGHLICDVPNTDKEIVESFVRWGGAIAHYKESGNRKEYWRWRIAAKAALPFLEQIRPFIRTIRVTTKIDLAMEFQKQKICGNRLCRTEAYYARQRDFYLKMRELNQRGSETSTTRKLTVWSQQPCSHPDPSLPLFPSSAPPQSAVKQPENKGSK